MHPHPDPLRPGLQPKEWRSSGRSSRRPPTWCCPTAVRSRVSTVTARPAPTCCPRCSVTTWCDAFREFKAIWDPDGRMNPGKVVDPHPAHGRPAPRRRLRARGSRDTYFALPRRPRQLRPRRRLRCVGVGKCRRQDGGTMCPSYMVTREEQHSTRGRARLLFEMMNGEVITDGWRSEAVRDALDLCLACKGCLGDCPVNVDMATYKAEFLAHHYKGRLRPAAHYSMGWLPLLAVAASEDAAARSTPSATPRASSGGQVGRRHRPAREIPRFARRRTLRSELESRGYTASSRPASRTPADGGPKACVAVAGHVHQPLRPPDRSGRSRRAGTRRFRGGHTRRRPVLRPHVDLHRAAGDREADAATHRASPSHPRCVPARRWSDSNPAAPRPSATTSANCSHTTTMPAG